MYTNMYFFIFILCLNTITSMINTNVFFDFTDFQVRKCESNTHRRGKRGGASGKWSNGWENVRGTWCLRGVWQRDRLVMRRHSWWHSLGLWGILCGNVFVGAFFLTMISFAMISVFSSGDRRQWHEHLDRSNEH